MKTKQIWIASGIAAGVAAAAFFLVKKYRKSNEVQSDSEDVNSMQTVPVQQPSRHVTDVFARAKHPQG